MITIRKASGELEPFDNLKLYQSLKKAGASDEIAEKIVTNIKNWLVQGVTTKKIYSRAFTLMRRENRVTASRYRLKESLYSMGPTGYPFEHLIGEIFRKRDYNVEVGKILEGSCITHEMDVIASNNSEQVLIECKYHKDQGKHVSVQVPLYVRSRVDDIVNKKRSNPDNTIQNYTGGIVTNTRFSKDSINYGNCSGLMLIGWDYPENNGLKDILEQEKIFPVTILGTLTRIQKEFIMEKGIVTCQQLLENIAIINDFNISDRKKQSINYELNGILGR